MIFAGILADVDWLSALFDHPHFFPGAAGRFTHRRRESQSAFSSHPDTHLRERRGLILGRRPLVARSNLRRTPSHRNGTLSPRRRSLWPYIHEAYRSRLGSRF